MIKTMVDFENLKNEEISARLQQHGYPNMPVTKTTRNLYIQILRNHFINVVTSTVNNKKMLGLKENEGAVRLPPTENEEDSDDSDIEINSDGNVKEAPPTTVLSNVTSNILNIPRSTPDGNIMRRQSLGGLRSRLRSRPSIHKAGLNFSPQTTEEYLQLYGSNEYVGPPPPAKQNFFTQSREEVAAAAPVANQTPDEGYTYGEAEPLVDEIFEPEISQPLTKAVKIDVKEEGGKRLGVMEYSMILIIISYIISIMIYYFWFY